MLNVIKQVNKTNLLESLDSHSAVGEKTGLLVSDGK